MNLDKIVFKIRNSELDENDVLKYGRILITEFAKEHHTEQLKLYEVNRSLPTKEEAIIEAKKQCVYIDTFNIEKMDFAQMYGFEKCYNWLKTNPSDNG